MEIGYRDHRRTVDLDAPLATVMIGQIVKGDANADRFVLELKNGGQPADLAGYSADGLFINRFGMEVPLRATVSGSKIEMVLTGGCYDVGGAAVGHVRLISSDASQIRTVIRFVADVTRDGSGVAYDPDGVIGDLDELLAKLTAMETATADGIAAAKEARSAGAQAIADANAAGEAAKATAQAAADDATAAAETARSTIYTRAVAIPDESALAASHELHAQRDYPLNVAVHGFTYQEGEGDPSPENVRPIHGLDAALVHVGTKNLITKNDFPWVPENQIIALDFGDDKDYHFEKLTLSIEFENAMYTAGSAALLNFKKSNGTNNFVTSPAFCKDPANQVINGRRSVTYYNVTFSKLYIYFEANSMGLWTGKIINAQLEPGSTATPYEPYCANVIEPPLLPDNSPLMEGDTVENWVRSGCDKCITFDGSDDEVWSGPSESGSFMIIGLIGLPRIESAKKYSNRYAAYKGFSWNDLPDQHFSSNETLLVVKDKSIATLAGWKVHLAANPLTVFYRSTDYTPDKDLRVCKVTRQYYTHEFDGTESAPISIIQGNPRFTIDINGKPGIYNNGFCTHFIERSAVIGMNNVNNAISCFNTTSVYLRADMFATTSELQEFFVQQKENGTPVTYTYDLATPETYMTDPLPLLQPAALESETVTVTGSGETEVTYAHETKHYIDSQIAAAVALALNG